MTERRELPYDWKDVRRRLQQRMPALLRRLKIDAQISNGLCMPRNPRRDDRKPGSFVIWCEGDAAGAWRDYACGDECAGDVFGLIAYLEGLARPIDVYWWARRHSSQAQRYGERLSPMTDPETAELIEEASAWRQYADGSDHAETHDLVTRMQSELGRLASEVARLQAEAGRLSGELTRIPTFLAERAAWFDYEARHGGDWDHLKRRVRPDSTPQASGETYWRYMTREEYVALALNSPHTACFDEFDNVRVHLAFPGPTPLERAAAALREEVALTDSVIAAMVAAYDEALAAKYADPSSYTDCPRCCGRGYHHGFGDDGNDPDWCENCGGAQKVCAVSDDEAAQHAMRAALALLHIHTPEGEK